MSSESSLPVQSHKRKVVFDYPSAGELQFVDPVLRAFADRNTEADIYLVYQGDTPPSVHEILPGLEERITLVPHRKFREARFPHVDMFLTTEQHRLGKNGTYSVSLFHGQPSKGLTFTKKIINSFDAFFLYGPMHRDAYDEFVQQNMAAPPAHLDLFDIGYPKSDAILNGQFDRSSILKKLDLDPSKRTVLYAPAFNEGASLRQNGPDIVRAIAEAGHYNVIVKLPIDCRQPTTDLYATGGVDWFDRLGELERRYSDVRLVQGFKVDPYLACSDVLVTCVSSVSFEFLSLGKPVVFFDTPDFYSGFLQNRFPDRDTVSWATKTTVNGGKEFGLVVSKADELPGALDEVLANPEKYPRHKEKLSTYLLFNRGTATDSAVSQIESLLMKNVSSRRTDTHGDPLWRTAARGVKRVVRRTQRSVGHTATQLLRRRGYSIEKTGNAFIDSGSVIRAAEAANLSICEYRERQESDTRKQGRRDRIVSHMEALGLFENMCRVVEIGAGTGMYLEKILGRSGVQRYDAYETDNGWRTFLSKTYASWNSGALRCPVASGESLGSTSSSTCDVVHAHAVFVYIPILKTLAYIKEAARVLKPGGHLVFDCFSDHSFGIQDVESWLTSSMRFPVILPEKAITNFARSAGLRLKDRFREIYGPATCEYLVFTKESH